MKTKCHNYKLVEKSNHHAVHGIFSDEQSAQRHLTEVIPLYVERRYFTDKSLTKDSFEIIATP